MTYSVIMKSKRYFKKVEDSKVTFDRTELGQILRLYGRMVSMGEWRDYGISMLKDFALFSINRHASENPIYQIKKTYGHAKNMNEIFSVLAMDGTILKRGEDLSKVLRILEKKLLRLVK